MQIFADSKEIRAFILQSDVNTVCFADESGHLIYSGSDDNLCKVDAVLSLTSGNKCYSCNLTLHIIFL